MTAADFLRAVWPETGIYCLYVPHLHGHPHRVYDSVAEAAAGAVQFAKTGDVFFTIHTLRERQVPHKDPVQAAAGKTQTRVQRNTAEARCFFFDLDVGPAKPFASQSDALLALKTFCKQTHLPRPLVTSSGGGCHVYWRLTDPIASEEWRDHATRLRQLAQHYGLKVDMKRTTDSASVLRPTSTSNWKTGSPRPVETLFNGAATPTGVFVKLISDAIVAAGVKAQDAPKLHQAESLLGTNTDMPYAGPKPKMRAVIEACQQMRRLWLINRSKEAYSEPEWYHTVIGLGRFTEGGNRDIHKLSNNHPNYSEASCNAKIRQSEGAQKGPSSCASVAATSDVGDSLCVGCPHSDGHVFGPIQAALKTESIDPPLHEEKIGDETVTIEIPPAPKPFTRTKLGISVVSKNSDGDETVQVIYDYDLYPVRRLANTQQGTEQQIWHVELPRGEAKDFTLDADMLYDIRKFVVAIAHQGIYPHKSHIPYLQEYMVAYIAQLQKLADADSQCNHLGWGDDQTTFILPDKILQLDGTAKPAQLSLGAQRASAHVHQRGTLEEQVRLLNFYNHPDYLPNQFFALAGLGAPIFFATGHHGVIVNASGDAGASKSTSLYTAASFWGQPELYPINGTNNGATIRGRNERVTVLANLPVCVDEITHMPVKDAVDLAMSITQPGHRIRLQTDGVERASTGSYKATIMLTTANNSLHSMLSMDNAAGTAGSMRVFEIVFVGHKIHEKWQADDYLFHLKQNYGWLGPQFIHYVMKHKERVVDRVRQVTREIDEAAKIQSSERYWSATIAVVLVTCEIAYELGLLRWSAAALRQWALEYQIPYMRGVITQEYSDPLSIVADYLEQIHGNIAVVRKHSGNIANIQHMPKNGALLAHYDLDDRMLYVLKKGFKDYCAKTGANSTKVIDDLHAPRDGERIVPQKHTRRVLGAGTEYAKAQSWCFAINMSHPGVAGTVLTAVTGGSLGGSGGEKPSLAIVK